MFENVQTYDDGTVIIRYTNPSRVRIGRGGLKEYTCCVCTNKHDSSDAAIKCAEKDHEAKRAAA